MDSAFTAWLPREVLDRVREVNRAAFDAGVGQRPIEQLAGRPDERTVGTILRLPWLLADQDDGGRRRPFTEHRLRRVFVQLARRTATHRFAEHSEITRVGNERPLRASAR